MASLHKKIFKEVCFLVAQKVMPKLIATYTHCPNFRPSIDLFNFQDASLNKITRNLSDIHPQNLGIKAQFR